MKTYISPAINILHFAGQEQLLQDSIKVSKSKVESTSDIGFVKGERSQRGDYNVWNEDWSK